MSWWVNAQVIYVAKTYVQGLSFMCGEVRTASRLGWAVHGTSTGLPPAVPLMFPSYDCSARAWQDKGAIRYLHS